MIEVLELDQFTACGDIEGRTMDEFREGLPHIEGDTPAVARAIFGGYGRVKMVDERLDPLKGYVWFTQQGDSLKVYRANYDSSD